MNNDYFMGGPMPYRMGNYMPSNGYAPSYLSTQMGNSLGNNMSNPNNTNIVWTMGLESAKAYPLLPGKTLMLMDSESPRFFIKTVDNSGYATLKAYTFQEEPSVSTSMAANFVTKEQLDAALSAILAEVKSSIAASAAKSEVTKSAEIEVETTKTKNLL